VSHLPHLIAFAMMQSLINQPKGQEYLQLAGPGFRDFTRIAASDPHMWRDIMLANREELMAQAQSFRQALQQLEQLIEKQDGDALEDLIAQASDTRADWRMVSLKPKK
jgi:prephenate dehydrogenase